MLTRTAIERSAWEESNLRAPVYQTGAWTGSATGGAGETRNYRAKGAAVFGTASSPGRICLTGPLPGRTPGSGGADSNRLLGGHIPALCRVSYLPGARSEEESNLRGHRRCLARLAPGCLTARPSLPNEAPGRFRSDALPLTRRVLCRLSYRSAIAGRDSNPRHVAYEAAARPLSYPALEVPPEGLEPSRARGPRRSERRAYAFRHGGVNGSGRARTRTALVFSQPLYLLSYRAEEGVWESTRSRT